MKQVDLPHEYPSPSPPPPPHFFLSLSLSLSLRLSFSDWLVVWLSLPYVRLALKHTFYQSQGNSNTWQRCWQMVSRCHIWPHLASETCRSSKRWTNRHQHLQCDNEQEKGQNNICYYRRFNSSCEALLSFKKRSLYMCISAMRFASATAMVKAAALDNRWFLAAILCGEK